MALNWNPIHLVGPMVARLRDWKAAHGPSIGPILRKACWEVPESRGWKRAGWICGLGLARLLALLAVLALAIDNNWFWLFGHSPSMAELRDPEVAAATEILSSDGEVLGRIWLEDRTPATRQELPQVLVDALVSTEDARFYEHSGIDAKAMLGAAFQNLRGGKRGGSTLAQQLAKNLFRTRSTPGLLGRIPLLNAPIAKFREWILAAKLESLHSKDEILVLYLNTVSFGNNSFGIHSAAWRYFGKQTRELAPQEAALLVGVLKGTAFYSPFQHPDRALARRNTVLQRMATEGKLTPKALDSLTKLDLGLHPEATTPSDGPSPHFRDWVAAWIRNFCKEKGCDPFTDGLVVQTTIDSRMQAHAMEAMDDWMPQLQARFRQDWGGAAPWRYADGKEIDGYLDSLARGTGRWKRYLDSLGHDTEAVLDALREKTHLRIFDGEDYRDTLISPIDSIAFEKKLLQGALVSLDPRTGAVLSWVGGIDHSFSQLDHVAGTRRSTGSTAKPFVYCTALEQGMSPCQKWVDSVRTFGYVEDGEKKYWTPHNADWISENDSVTLRAGMARSLNTITSQVTMKVGPDKVAETMHRLGVKSALKVVPSIGLGSNALTLLELAGAYQPFVNGGLAIDPWAIRKVTDRKGKILFEAEAKSKRVLTPEIAFLMTWMLRGGLTEPDGTSLALRSYDLFQGGRDLGGKTGTSSDHADGWYVAVSPQIVTAAWTGNDDPSMHFRSGETGEGSRTGLPLVGRFLTRVFHDTALSYPPVKFPDPPAGLKVRWNCPTPWPPKDTTSEDSAASASPLAGGLF